VRNGWVSGQRLVLSGPSSRERSCRYLASWNPGQTRHLVRLSPGASSPVGADPETWSSELSPGEADRGLRIVYHHQLRQPTSREARALVAEQLLAETERRLVAGLGEQWSVALSATIAALGEDDPSGALSCELADEEIARAASLDRDDPTCARVLLLAPRTAATLERWCGLAEPDPISDLGHGDSADSGAEWIVSRLRRVWPSWSRSRAGAIASAISEPEAREYVFSEEGSLSDHRGRLEILARLGFAPREGDAVVFTDAVPGGAWGDKEYRGVVSAVLRDSLEVREGVGGGARVVVMPSWIVSGRRAQRRSS
jgi:hypothetical protein